jgi:nanoRNase/pAp phosphatase (c-di-AMP/oligoRNAs hydrolase)
MPDSTSQKHDIPTIAEKNRVVDRIVDTMLHGDRFLVLGHKQPDEDCLSSMVSIGLVLSKLSKDVELLTDETLPDHFQYLVQICKYNTISVNEHLHKDGPLPDAVFMLDTPKPDMLQLGEVGRKAMNDPGVTKIEIDHHLEADSVYCGDKEYSLVAEASSAAELVGYLACKMNTRELLVENHPVPDLFSRNLVLAILTGIIGDTQMGKYIKTRKEQRFYSMFSEMFNRLLVEKTTKRTNFFNMQQVYTEIRRLSNKEASFYDFMMERKHFSDNVGYVALDQSESAYMHGHFDDDTVSSVARGVADDLAESSGTVSLVAFYDFPEKSDLVQFRSRRSQQTRNLDLRDLLERMGIENGGGHEGAIGFRIPKDKIGDFHGYISEIISNLEQLIMAKTGDPARDA